MIEGYQKQDIAAWKKQLINYQMLKKGLLLNKSSGNFLPSQTSKKHCESKILEKSCNLQQKKNTNNLSNQVDRSLKRYMHNRFRYEKPYDIISLSSQEELSTEGNIQKSRKSKIPIRNIYDIINGQKIKEVFLKERQIILPKFYQKKSKVNNREFNIINLQYNTKSQFKQKQQALRQKQLLKRYQSTHEYDKIYSRYYNPQEEKSYWKNKKEDDLKLAKQQFDKKLPKSYQIRERYIQDLTKPLPIALEQLDKIYENKRNSHLAKYIFQQKQRRKNIQTLKKAQRRLQNRFQRTNQFKLKDNIQFSQPRINHKDYNKIKSFGFEI